MSLIALLRPLDREGSYVFKNDYGTVLLTNQTVRVLKSDPARVAVLFMPTSTGTVYLGLDNQVSATNGLPVSNLTGIMTIDDDHFPGAAGQEWWVYTAGTSVAVGYLTTTLVG